MNINKLTPHQTNLVLNEVHDGKKSFTQIAFDYNISPVDIEEYYKEVFIKRYNAEFAPVEKEATTKEKIIAKIYHFKDTAFFKFATKIFLMYLGILIAIDAPSNLIKLQPDIDLSVGVGITAAFTGIARGLIGLVFIETLLFLTRDVLYAFIKDDGNEKFDYKISFTKLKPEFQCLLTDLKIVAYMLYFALLSWYS